MSIMELGALGEFLGSIGVIITLVYLAIQVRHSKEAMDANTKSIKAQISQARTDNISANMRAVVHSDHLPRIGALESSAADKREWFDNLSAEDRYRWRMWVVSQLNDVRNQFYQYQQGFLDESIWSTSTRGQIMRMLKDLPYFLPAGWGQPIDPEFWGALNTIAKEEGLPEIDDTGRSGTA